MKDYRYHIYAKSPLSQRFGRIPGRGFERKEKAIRVMLDLYCACPNIDTAYQVRQNNRVVYECITKGVNGG